MLFSDLGLETREEQLAVHLDEGKAHLVDVLYERHFDAIPDLAGHIYVRVVHVFAIRQAFVF